MEILQKITHSPLGLDLNWFYRGINMKIKPIITITLCLLLFTTGYPQASETKPTSTIHISGTVVSGYRVIPITMAHKDPHITVYRGDYIKFKFDQSFSNPKLSIPELSIDQKLPDNFDEAPYFKMKTTGTFAFSLGDANGDITVVEYHQPNYKAVSSKEAKEVINNIHPLILDVRTPMEYKMGHIKNSVLIPVQDLQTRIKELSQYKNENILVYCATGNRSTVASKILIDNGFKRLFNLQYGIYDWSKKKYPVVR